MAPVFTTKNVQIVGDIRYAKGNTHIFKLKENDSNIIFEAMFFSSEKLDTRSCNGKIL